MKEVVVVIPHHSSHLSSFEEISLRQCVKILGSHPIILTCPEGMDVSFFKEIIPDLHIDYLDEFWFSSIRRYNLLKMSKSFYERYVDYDYLLTYELDSFVFKDELLKWCGKGYDYIGAPWFKGYGRATESSELLRVGNSGFSLRCVRSSLKALMEWPKYFSPRTVWRNLFSPSSSGFEYSLVELAREKKHFGSFLKLLGLPKDEDIFWCHVVADRFTEFKLAPISEGLRFSFEEQPRRLFAINREQLPFGCHGWWKYDFEFWQPFIRSCGYEV